MGGRLQGQRGNLSTAVITRSKRGYGYQHRFALFTVLSRFSDKISCAFVDYPLENGGAGGKGLSLDLMLNFRDRTTIEAFEIKTGTSFKSDKDSEITRTLTSFYVYEGLARVECKKRIIISPPWRSPISGLFDDLNFLKDSKKKNNSGETKKQVLERRYKEHSFGAQELNCSVEMFKQFFLTLDVADGPPYHNRAPESNHINLDHQLNQTVQTLAESFGASVGYEVVPTSAIVAELLDVVVRCSERNSDLMPPLATALAVCFARRKLWRHVCSKCPGEIDSYFKSAKREMKNLASELTGIELDERASVIPEEVYG